MGCHTKRPIGVVCVFDLGVVPCLSTLVAWLLHRFAFSDQLFELLDDICWYLVPQQRAGVDFGGRCLGDAFLTDSGEGLCKIASRRYGMLRVICGITLLRCQGMILGWGQGEDLLGFLLTRGHGQGSIECLTAILRPSVLLPWVMRRRHVLHLGLMWLHVSPHSTSECIRSRVLQQVVKHSTGRNSNLLGHVWNEGLVVTLGGHEGATKQYHEEDTRSDRGVTFPFDWLYIGLSHRGTNLLRLRRVLTRVGRDVWHPRLIVDAQSVHVGGKVVKVCVRRHHVVVFVRVFELLGQVLDLAAEVAGLLSVLHD